MKVWIGTQIIRTSIRSIIHTQTLHPCDVIDSQCLILKSFLKGHYVDMDILHSQSLHIPCQAIAI